MLGFDGSYTGDSTALVGATLGPNPYLFVVGCWETPEGREDWLVPREEVRAVVDRAFERWKVRELACDPPGWYREIDEWAEQYGGKVVLRYQTNNARFMAEACSRFYTAVIQPPTHPRRRPPTRPPPRQRQSSRTPPPAATSPRNHTHSPKKIDLAVAAVIAYDRATQAKPASKPRLIWLHEI